MDDSSFAFNANNPPSHMEAAVPQQPSEGNLLTDSLFVVLFILLMLLCIPFFLLYAIVAYFFFDVNALDIDEEDGDPQVTTISHNKGLYQKAQEIKQTAKGEAKLISAIWSRFVILSLIWLVLDLSIPMLRNKIILGSKLWRWTLLLTAICCGYPLVTMATRILLYHVSSSDDFKARKNVVYFATGLRRSVNWIILFGSVFIAWVAYFEKMAEDDEGRDLLRTGTWTLVTALVGAVLWLLKNVLLLKWEADAIYRRFSERILRVGFQLYFLALIDGRRFDEFQPARGAGASDERHEVDDEDQDERRSSTPLPSSGVSAFQYPLASNSSVLSFGRQPDNFATHALSRTRTPPTNAFERTERKNNEREELKRRKAKDILIKRRRASEEATTNDIKQKAKYFQYLYVVSSREGDGISDLQNKFNLKIPKDHTEIKKKDLMDHFGLDEDDAKLLYTDELQAEDSSKVSYQTFEKWMLKAHKNCLVLGYTLSDAKGVADVLNKVMTGFLIIVVIVTWLLLTKMAKIEVLILIASPFLAATFVFGETCRRIFEGVVFSFISHPFDVGDRCIIDGIELEVKHMSVLTTTFTKIGLTSEEAFYPNSVLATKSIINLKGDPDPEDIVELTLEANSTTNPALDKLRSNIHSFLKGDKRFEHENESIVVK